jgi:hypothetical protein
MCHAQFGNLKAKSWNSVAPLYFDELVAED